jgi:hypothetical protein
MAEGVQSSAAGRFGYARYSETVGAWQVTDGYHPSPRHPSYAPTRVVPRNPFAPEARGFILVDGGNRV